MARAFEAKPARPSAPCAAQQPAVPTHVVRTATNFAQLASRPHVGTPLQRHAADSPTRDFSDIAGPGRPAASGGLPTGLRADVEARSGLPMDDVRVHRNSDTPARLGALAYARGRDIHLGPGQEQHLPHEAWHVVQQKQGRVRPTLQSKGIAINNDPGLEREADGEVLDRRPERPQAGATEHVLQGKFISRKGDSSSYSTHPLENGYELLKEYLESNKNIVEKDQPIAVILQVYKDMQVSNDIYTFDDFLAKFVFLSSALPGIKDRIVGHHIVKRVYHNSNDALKQAFNDAGIPLKGADASGFLPNDPRFTRPRDEKRKYKHSNKANKLEVFDYAGYRVRQTLHHISEIFYFYFNKSKSTKPIEVQAMFYLSDTRPKLLISANTRAAQIAIQSLTAADIAKLIANFSISKKEGVARGDWRPRESSKKIASQSTLNDSRAAKDDSRESSKDLDDAETIGTLFKTRDFTVVINEAPNDNVSQTAVKKVGKEHKVHAEQLLKAVFDADTSGKQFRDVAGTKSRCAACNKEVGRDDTQKAIICADCIGKMWTAQSSKLAEYTSEFNKDNPEAGLRMMFGDSERADSDSDSELPSKPAPKRKRAELASGPTSDRDDASKNLRTNASDKIATETPNDKLAAEADEDFVEDADRLATLEDEDD